MLDTIAQDISIYGSLFILLVTILEILVRSVRRIQKLKFVRRNKRALNSIFKTALPTLPALLVLWYASARLDHYARVTAQVTQLSNAARDSWAEKDTISAMAKLKRASILDPSNAHVFMIAGMYELKMKRYADAVTSYEKALSIIQNDNRYDSSIVKSALLGVAISKINTNDNPWNIQPYLLRAWQIDSNDLSVNYHLGLLHTYLWLKRIPRRQDNDYNAAMRYYTRCIDGDHDYLLRSYFNSAALRSRLLGETTDSAARSELISQISDGLGAMLTRAKEQSVIKQPNIWEERVEMIQSDADLVDFRKSSAWKIFLETNTIPTTDTASRIVYVSKRSSRR